MKQTIMRKLIRSLATDIDRLDTNIGPSHIIWNNHDLQRLFDMIDGIDTLIHDIENRLNA